MLSRRVRNGASAVVEACREFDLSCDGMHLLSIGRCLIFSLPIPQLCARVALPDYSGESLKAELLISQQFAATGLPFLTPTKLTATKPIVTQFGSLTLWPLLHPADDHELDWRWIGGVLRSLHDSAVPENIATVSLWRPLDLIVERINSYMASDLVKPEIASMLSDAAAVIETDMAFINRSFPQTLIHGDIHSDNILFDGLRPTIFDYDLAGLGPATWDLTEAIALERHGSLSPHSLAELVAGYGRDALLVPGIERVVRLRELLDVSYMLTLVGRHGEAEGELVRQLHSWHRAPEDRTIWRFFRAEA